MDKKEEKKKDNQHKLNRSCICHWSKHKDSPLQRVARQCGMNGLKLAMNGAKNWPLKFYSILSRTKGYSIYDPERERSGNIAIHLPNVYSFATHSPIFYFFNDPHAYFFRTPIPFEVAPYIFFEDPLPMHIFWQSPIIFFFDDPLPMCFCGTFNHIYIFCFHSVPLRISNEIALTMSWVIQNSKKSNNLLKISKVRKC